MIKIDKNNFIKTTKSAISMAQASQLLNLHFNTFRKYAKEFGVYVPNQGLKGTNKKKLDGKGKIPLSEIIYENKHPEYQTNKLRNRLISEGVKKAQCEKCNLIKWKNKPVSFELNHKDGNRFNHFIDNLEIICPNCHSQTKTYRGRNIK